MAGTLRFELLFARPPLLERCGARVKNGVDPVLIVGAALSPWS